MQPSRLNVAGNDVIEMERGGNNSDKIEYWMKPETWLWMKLHAVWLKIKTSI